MQPLKYISGVLSMQRWSDGVARVCAALLLWLSNHWSGSCFTWGCRHVRLPSVTALWLVNTAAGNYSGMTSGHLECLCQTFTLKCDYLTDSDQIQISILGQERTAELHDLSNSINKFPLKNACRRKAFGLT